MKFVGGMHHHKYNGMDSFFVSNEFAIDFFSPCIYTLPTIL